MGMASSSMYSINYTTQWSSKAGTPHEWTIRPKCEDPHEWIGVKGEKNKATIRVGCEPSGKSPYGDGPLSGRDSQIGVLCCITPALILVKSLGRKLFKIHILILLTIAVYYHPNCRATKRVSDQIRKTKSWAELLN